VLVNDWYKFEPYEGEKNSGKDNVERVGYIPIKRQYMNFLAAGQRLTEYRLGEYDFQDEKSIDDDFSDPTRDKGFDMVDAHQIMLNLASVAARKARDGRLKALEDEKLKKAAAAASEAAKDVSAVVAEPAAEK
jgi:hypothetical protein